MSWYKGISSSWDGEKPFSAWHDKWEDRKDDKKHYHYKYKSNPSSDYHSKSWDDDDKYYHSKSWREESHWDEDWKSNKYPRSSTHRDDSEDTWFTGWVDQGTSSSSNSSYPTRNYSTPNTEHSKPEKRIPSTPPLPAAPYLHNGKLFDGASELLASQLPCFFQLKLGKCDRGNCKFLHCEALLEPKFQINREKWIDLLNRRKQQATRQEAAREDEPNSNSHPSAHPKSKPSPPEADQDEPSASSDSAPTKRNRPENQIKEPPIGSGQTSYYNSRESDQSSKRRVKLIAPRDEPSSGRTWKRPPGDEYIPTHKSPNQMRGRTRSKEDRSLSPPSSADEQIRGEFDTDVRDTIPTEEEDLKQYDIQYPNPSKGQIAEMMVELQIMLESITRHLEGRDTDIDYQINSEQFPTALVTYWASVMVMNGWAKQDLHQVKFLRDDDGFIWIWIKFRPYQEDGTFTKIKSSRDHKFRFCHGTTPAGNFGISHNILNSASQAILPQMGSLSYKSYVAQKGLFALAFEVSEDKDNDYGELKAVINAFKDHGKNQIGVGWTGLITGPKCGKKHGAWAAQKILAEDPKCDIVTVGGRVFCIRCSRATVDGAFIKIATQPPAGYNPSKPFQLG